MTNKPTEIILCIIWQELTRFIFTVEYLDVEVGDTDDPKDCYDYLTISFDGGDVKLEWVREVRSQIDFCTQAQYDAYT